MKNGQEWIRLSTKLIHSKAFGLDNFVHVNQFISENPKKGRGWNRDDIHLTNENWKMNGNWWIEFKWPLYLLLWQETLGRTVVALIVQNVILGCNLKNDRMISVSFQGDPFNITGIKSMPQSLMWWLYPWTSPDAQ